MYKYDKDELKESLSIDQVYELVAELGGEPQMFSNYFIARTICHNPVGEGSRKLYYYSNTHLFRCYTSCSEYMDIFELVRKQMTIRTGEEWTLPQAITFVANFFGFSSQNFDFPNVQDNLQDWKILNKYDKNNSVQQEQRVELKTFNQDILKHLPSPSIKVWEDEGILPEVMHRRGICYDPKNQGIVIPHFDINGNLIGIRERTLIKENEKYGKYMPATLNNQMYNHPLSFSLYNLNNSKDNIRAMRKVIVGEGEKFCMLYASYFGEDFDITVAVCGSNLINYQVQLLLSLGVEEIIIAFDKQFKEIGDEEWRLWTKKLTDIHKKYSGYAQISFMFDKWNLLDYKMSPIDKDKETFMKLFKERITL